jgi:hypothetical protein
MRAPHTCAFRALEWWGRVTINLLLYHDLSHPMSNYVPLLASTQLCGMTTNSGKGILPLTTADDKTTNESARRLALT